MGNEQVTSSDQQQQQKKEKKKEKKKREDDSSIDALERLFAYPKHDSHPADSVMNPGRRIPV